MFHLNILIIVIHGYLTFTYNFLVFNITQMKIM